MKFGYAILYVDDVEATLSFYNAAFGLTQKMLHKTDDGTAYGELDTGATTVAFLTRHSVATLVSIPIQAGGPGVAPPPVEFGLVTDDVRAAFDKAIAAGSVMVAEPVKKPWGQTVGYVRDNNGFLIEICSPIG